MQLQRMRPCGGPQFCPARDPSTHTSSIASCSCRQSDTTASPRCAVLLFQHACSPHWLITRTHAHTHARTHAHTHTHARTWFHVHVVLIGVSAACVSCAVFNVEQDSSPKIVGIAASNDTLFTVTDLQPATAYTFVVRARNKYGESAIGAAVTITTRDAREFPVAFVCVSVCVRVCLFVCACLSTCTHVRPASGCIHSHTHTHARTQHVRTRSTIGPWSPVCSSDWRRERCAVGSPRAAQREHHAV